MARVLSESNYWLWVYGVHWFTATPGGVVSHWRVNWLYSLEVLSIMYKGNLLSLVHSICKSNTGKKIVQLLFWGVHASCLVICLWYGGSYHNSWHKVFFVYFKGLIIDDSPVIFFLHIHKCPYTMTPRKTCNSLYYELWLYPAPILYWTDGFTLAVLFWPEDHWITDSRHALSKRTMASAQDYLWKHLSYMYICGIC